ncbi:OmpA family protein [Variovorax sp. PDC80]|uniref:OmpA family protein n=1 Tax=Variovorax sp. PDC80 TaxID=1882827 RepID=UPI000B863088|nr:OmpA family protein [Variovorax sp. PDC80]
MTAFSILGRAFCAALLVFTASAHGLSPAQSSEELKIGYPPQGIALEEDQRARVVAALLKTRAWPQTRLVVMVMAGSSCAEGKSTHRRNLAVARAEYVVELLKTHGVAEAEIHVAAVANNRMEYLPKGPVHPVAEEPGAGAYASLHFMGYPERP